MSKLAKVFAVVALALWGVATMHCELEHLPGFQFLAWCHPQESAPEEENDCGGDGCSVVESGLYRAEEQAANVPAPMLTLSFLPPLCELILPTHAPYPAMRNGSPPPLPQVWQFHYRTALPPRAPSLLS